jgi:glutamate-1-semialdehyde aminotransferase
MRQTKALFTSFWYNKLTMMKELKGYWKNDIQNVLFDPLIGFLPCVRDQTRHCKKRRKFSTKPKEADRGGKESDRHQNTMNDHRIHES